MWIIHIVVIYPSLVIIGAVRCVVRRIDIDTVHPTFVLREQRLERKQIVPVNDHILGAFCIVCIFLLKNLKRHFLVMIDHFLFSDPFQRWHLFGFLNLHLFSNIFQNNYQNSRI